MQKKKIFFIMLFYTASSSVLADSTNITINNNGAAQNNPPTASSPCSNYRDNSGMQPGTYYQSNPRGGTNTVYTTGDKQPFIVDPNCNNNNTTPIVQPYIFGPRIGPR